MERNSFKEYSVLAMVSKEEQRPIKTCHNFFHLDRVIAWLDEVAKVAHNNTSRRLGKKNMGSVLRNRLKFGKMSREDLLCTKM